MAAKSGLKPRTYAATACPAVRCCCACCTRCAISCAVIRARFISLTPLGLTVSNPPTQADVQAIADKLDELINTLST